MVRLLPAQQLQGEDGHHARFAVRVLPGPVDVGVAQDRVVEAVIGLVGEEVVLDGVLAHAVGRDGVDGMGLVHREVAGLAEEGAAGAGVDDLADAVTRGSTPGG